MFSGLLHWLAQNDGFDASMLQHLNGVSETLAAATQWDVARVAETCDLTEQQVTNFFRLFSQHDRVLTLWCMGINQSATGSDNNQAILNLHLLTGKIGRAGCGPFSLTGQPIAIGCNVSGTARRWPASRD